MRVQQRVRLFGAIKVEDDGGPRRVAASDKAVALLGFLVRQREAVTRGPLAALLWGDTSDYRSRRNLTRALGQLTVEFPGGLQADQQRVRWATGERIWVDVATCDRLLRAAEGRGDDPAAITALEQAVELYRGEFLADLALDSCPEFETWLLRERERWRQQITGAIETLIGHHLGHGRADAGERYARLWLELEPWQEDAHRTLILLLAQAGRRGDALAQYETCVRALDAELGVGPAPETTALYQRLRAGAFEPLAQRPATPYELAVNRPALLPAPSAARAWSDAPAPGPCFGRERELTALQRLAFDGSCQVAALVGVGGVGKTVLAARLADAVGERFDAIVWRSLAAAPRPEALLSGLIAALDEAPPPAADADQQLAQLLALLRRRRCLLVLDGWEQLLRPASHGGEYLAGYESYGRLLAHLGAHRHQSTLVFTSREAPWGFDLLAADGGRVQLVGVAGLELDAARRVLRAWGVSAPPADEAELVACCDGNPLALQVIAGTARDLFDGRLAALLDGCTLVFGQTRAVAEQQWQRLSHLEQEILSWLAALPHGVPTAELQHRVGAASWPDLIEALRSLKRRSLIAQGHTGFTAQPLIAAYIGELLADRGALGGR